MDGCSEGVKHDDIRACKARGRLNPSHTLDGAGAGKAGPQDKQLAQPDRSSCADVDCREIRLARPDTNLPSCILPAAQWRQQQLLRR